MKIVVIFLFRYVGVGESEDVQLFYYFAKSERNPGKDPLILWLSGGPGCSGICSLFYEIGQANYHFNIFAIHGMQIILWFFQLVAKMG